MMNLPMYRTTVPPSIKDVCRAIGKHFSLGRSHILMSTS